LEPPRSHAWTDHGEESAKYTGQEQQDDEMPGNIPLQASAAGPWESGKTGHRVDEEIEHLEHATGLVEFKEKETVRTPMHPSHSEWAELTPPQHSLAPLRARHAPASPRIPEDKPLPLPRDEYPRHGHGYFSPPGSLEHGELRAQSRPASVRQELPQRDAPRHGHGDFGPAGHRPSLQNVPIRAHRPASVRDSSPWRSRVPSSYHGLEVGGAPRRGAFEKTPRQLGTAMHRGHPYGHNSPGGYATHNKWHVQPEYLDDRYARGYDYGYGRSEGPTAGPYEAHRMQLRQQRPERQQREMPRSMGSAQGAIFSSLRSTGQQDFQVSRKSGSRWGRRWA